MAPSEVKGTLRSAEARKNFLFAGRAEFSLRSYKTGEHYTYRVQASRNPSRRGTLYYVNAGKNWDCIGHLFLRSNGALEFEPRYGLRGKEPYVLPFHWFVYHLGDDQVEFWHVGKCGRCRRPLTDPESIARGIGPECYSKQMQMRAQEVKEEVKDLFQ